MVVFVTTAISLKGSVLMVTNLANSGSGTLRNQVAASSSGDTIQFAVTGTILLSSSINIPHTLAVQGPGPASLTIDAGGVDRAFITAGNPVILSGMTITNGLAMGTNGLDGGTNSMLVDGSPGGNAIGGAIVDTNSSSDVLILSNCWLVGNAAVGGKGGNGVLTFAGSTGGNGGPGGYAWGGAVYFLGQQATCINCTFSSNRAIGGNGGNGGANTSLVAGSGGGTGAGGGQPAGGALTGTRFYSINCTFSGNSVSGGSGGNGGNAANGAGGAGGSANQGNDGGAVNVAYCLFLSCTIVSNSAFAGTGGTGGTGSPAGADGLTGTAYAGGVYGFTEAGCSDTITNTILADNYAQTGNTNYLTYWLDGGYNFIGSVDYPVACSFASTTQTGTVANPIHPLLGPLAQNGGGLPTHATSLSSPVTDQGYSFSLSTDERGAPRTYSWGLSEPSGGDGTDIGAFELGSSGLSAGMVANIFSMVEISWPAYYGDLTLQSVARLQRTNIWNNVTDAPVLVGNRLVITKPATNSMSFYRLIVP